MMPAVRRRNNIIIRLNQFTDQTGFSLRLHADSTTYTIALFTNIADTKLILSTCYYYQFIIITEKFNDVKGF